MALRQIPESRESLITTAIEHSAEEIGENGSRFRELT
jgi:hypothetical protein